MVACLPKESPQQVRGVLWTMEPCCLLTLNICLLSHVLVMFSRRGGGGGRGERGAGEGESGEEKKKGRG